MKCELRSGENALDDKDRKIEELIIQYHYRFVMFAVA